MDYYSFTDPGGMEGLAGLGSTVCEHVSTDNNVNQQNTSQTCYV